MNAVATIVRTAGRQRRAVIALALLASTAAHAFSTAPYFPLGDGNQWVLRDSLGNTTTMTVQPGSVPVNGTLAKRVTQTTRTAIGTIGTASADTLDSFDGDGYRRHQASVQASGVTVTITGNPVYLFIPSEVSVGQTIEFSGTATFSVSTGVTVDVSLTSTVTIQPSETVTVPAGTFTDTLKFSAVAFFADPADPSDNLTISTTHWAAAGVGVIKQTVEFAGNRATVSLVSSNLIRSTPANPADCLFNWAERTYATLFAPAGATSITLPPYYYRYYSQTRAYLATSSTDNHVYYLGPISGNAILDVGALSTWLATAACQ